MSRAAPGRESWPGAAACGYAAALSMEFMSAR